MGVTVEVSVNKVESKYSTVYNFNYCIIYNIYTYYIPVHIYIYEQLIAIVYVYIFYIYHQDRILNGSFCAVSSHVRLFGSWESQSVVTCGRWLATAEYAVISGCVQSRRTSKAGSAARFLGCFLNKSRSEVSHNLIGVYICLQ